MKHPESQIQRAIVQYLSILEGQGKLFFFAVPNQGGKGLAKRGAMLKGLGLRAGVPDLCVCLPHGQIQFVEVKTDSGHVSVDQAKTFAALTLLGFRPDIVRSLDDMIALCREWGLVK